MISEKYVLEVYPELPYANPNRRSLAKVVSKDKGLLAMNIAYRKELCNAHLCFEFTGEMYQIVMDDLYADLLYTDREAFEALAMYRLSLIIQCEPGGFPGGNVEDGHHWTAMLDRGELMPRVLAADRFAAEHCGKGPVLRMLDHCISVEKQSFLSEYKVMELELQKKDVESL